MRNKSTKIAKLLYKASLMKNEALTAKKQKKYKKKMISAEKLCRKALELSRADITAGINSDFNDLISSIYGLTSILCFQERVDEAEPLLAEARSLDGFEGHMYSIAVNSYYGCILCGREEYNEAGEIFDKIMDEAQENQYAAFTDVYALCEAYSNAACAFTYAETGTGYPGERFVEPLNRLLEIKQKGFDVSDNAIKKAAYFAASQQLYYMCFDSPAFSDSESTVKTATLCLAFCKTSEKNDFYIPAAMRILAFAAARDRRFGDCVEICNDTLDVCSKYKDDMGYSLYGSIQDIAADMNLLLGIMHYRASHFEECIKYFEAAVAALEADAQGKPLNTVGYVEVEAIIIAMTSAEKAAFAYKYIGLAMFSLNEKYRLNDCLSMIKKGIELIISVSEEPYFYLRASSEYHMMAQICNSAGDLQNVSKFDELSRKYGYFAISNLNKCIDDRELYEQYFEKIQSHKRIALRHGLLEQYGDYLRCQIMLCEEPYNEPDHCVLAKLNFHLGEHCRILGKYESAVEYYGNVREHTFDDNGNMYDELKKFTISENAMLSKAACLAKLGNMAEARMSFREFIEIDKITSGGVLSMDERIRIAHLSRECGLNPAECAEYLHTAALSSADDGSDYLRTAELLNQEGICWYNSSPENNDPNDDCNCDECESHCEKFRPMSERYAVLAAEFAKRELEAFESAYRELLKCDQQSSNVLDLMPSLLSNIGECYVRRENLDEGIDYYKKSIKASENLFVSPSFAEKSDPAKETYVFQYGVCFKILGEIYEQKGDNENSAQALTQAVEVLEKIESETANDELVYCLNARGCVNYRMGDYNGEVVDITRAIKLTSDSEGSEIPIAIMLKNRSDAYRALGDYKSMQSDLTKSIDMLDNSGMPEGMLNSIYGSHWFSLGLCQEELNKAGKAADSYRKAAKYISSSKVLQDNTSNIFMQVMCHFRRAVCLCQRNEQEYYGALFEYNSAIKLLEELPPSQEKNENLRMLLSSRGSLYEAFHEIDLAKADYSRAESLKVNSDNV